MNIYLPKQPKNGLQIIKKELKILRQQDDAVAASINQSANSAKLSISVPHPVFFIGLDQIANKDFSFNQFGKAQTWRYLLLDNKNPFAFVYLRYQNNKTLEFSHLNYGRTVKRFINALNFAEKINSSGKQRHELNLLDIPSISTLAIWLKGSENMFILLIKDGKTTSRFKIYQESEFLKIIRLKASQKLKSKSKIIKEK